MKLKGINFGNVFGASGVQGFFGEGYWFHKPLGIDLSKITFVSKTSTLLSRPGNMPLNRRYRPINPFPGCIKTKAIRGVMLNSVGLSGPGLGALLGTNQWQQRTKPFLISIMSVAGSPEQRLQELRIMVEMLIFCKEYFCAPFGLQINLSCPNTGHDPGELISESAKVLEIASALDVPLMPKYSIASAPIEALMELNDHPYCDAICVSNTIPFNWAQLDWQYVWGSNKSPLNHLGGGGLSGKVLGPLVRELISRLRDAGFTKPINGGGGVYSSEDVVAYHKAGASSIFIGSVTSQRWWRIKKIIDQANHINWE